MTKVINAIKVTFANCLNYSFYATQAYLIAVIRA